MTKQDKKRANSIITVTRFDGKLQFTVHGVGTLTLDPNAASAENRSRMMYHGGEQRVRDAAALSVNRDTGKPATPQEKFEAMKRIVDHLNNPANTEWNLKPAAQPGVDAGLVIMAIMRVYKDSLAAKFGWVAGQDPVEAVEKMLANTMAKRGLDRAGALKLWASTDKVAAAILDIKRERLNSTINSDDLLDEIESADEDEEGDDEGDEEAPF